MKKAGDVISALFKDRFGTEFMETAKQNAWLFASWKKIVSDIWQVNDFSGEEEQTPPAVAVHSRVKELERGLLMVEVDHPGWIQILQTKQRQLLKAVQRKFPELNIRAIAFRLGRDPLINEEPLPEPPEISEKNSSPVYTVERSAVQDEDFYNALKGLEASIKERNGL